MITGLPFNLNLLFIAATFLAVWLLYKASDYAAGVIVVCSCWLAAQLFLALGGFFAVTHHLPPRFLLLPLPPLIFIAILLFTRWGKQFIDRLDPALLTWLHTVRIPVELCLYWLFLYKHVPQLMTFEGRNLDILAGLSAPFAAYFGYHKRALTRNTLLAWNFICLLLLSNIVFHSVASVPFGHDSIAPGQPNRAMLYFPFVWLPGCIVPIVLLSHLVCIRKLRKKPETGLRVEQ